MVSEELFDIIHIFLSFLIDKFFFFPEDFLNIFSLSLTLCTLKMICPGVEFWGLCFIAFILLGVSELPGLWFGVGL